jgi:hypothetical protein
LVYAHTSAILDTFYRWCQGWYLHIKQSWISQERRELQKFYQRAYIVIINYLYNAIKQTLGENSLQRHFNDFGGIRFREPQTTTFRYILYIQSVITLCSLDFNLGLVLLLFLIIPIVSYYSMFNSPKHGQYIPRENQGWY